MSHRLFRGALMPFTTGLAAVMAVLVVLGSAPAFGATRGIVAGSTIRSQEWWLTGLNVTQAWRTSEGAGIIVAVLGTGVDAGQPNLAGDVITGPDYSGSGRVPGSPYWGVAGTAVAGVIAGHGYNGDWGQGIVGIAPDARILSVRVTLEFNDPLVSDQAISQRLPDAIADGIRYAVNHGARVIDLPLDPGTLGLTSSGDPAAAGGSAAERAAVGYALRNNVLLVAPAGDDGQGSQIVNYPAAYPGVISVGAIGRGGQLAAFSSRRSDASLTAPGVRLVTAVPGGYGQISSTSAASAIVAGVAALILSEFPHLTVAQVTRALIESTVTAADGTSLPPLPGRSLAGAGYGTVDAVRAIEMAALLNSFAQARPPAIARPRPVAAGRPTAASSRPASSGALGSVLRGAVAALGALIVLVLVALVVARSRRGRAAAPRRTRAAGQHEHRRADRASAGSVTPPDSGAGPGPQARPQVTGPAPAAADGWPSAAGWQGSGIGEISHPSSAPSRPVLAPAPRPATGYRAGRGAAAQPDQAGPPWQPAPQPGRTTGPLPVAAGSLPRPEPGSSIRVPRDMVAPGESPVPPADESAAAGSDLATPPADFDLSSPAFGLTPAVFGFAAPPATPADEEPGLAAPPPPASLTQEDLGFAAAPVPSEVATAPAAEPAPEDDSGSAVSADPSYIWNLAATDVFPAAAPVPPADGGGAPQTAGTPQAIPADTVPPPPDAPGDGGT
ncbi:MAG TPA: S8 family serine peptidase [Streptosporangiaceae bacterium]|nr:S8 family serine peptidase [Streptosporangiaceae bacterium]